MVITLECVSELGGDKKSKKLIGYKKQFETMQMLVENFVTSAGVVSKKYCLVKQDGEYHRVKCKFEDIDKLNKKLKIKGFGK